MVRGKAVHLVEEAGYPFNRRVSITVNPSSALEFPLQVRIPAWARGTKIAVNGKPVSAAEPGTFARIDREWKQGDRVDVEFPMQPRVSRWFNDSVAIERGPLVFSYGIGESWVKLRNRGMTADWQVFPKSQWNYAVKLDTGSPAQGIEVVEREVGEGPFTRSHAPVELKVKARKVDEWRAEDGVAKDVPQSPVKTSQPEEIITLVPYAAAKLRITAFPVLQSTSQSS